MGLKLTKNHPVCVLALVASTTGLLIYSLGDFDAPDIIKYFTYLYSTAALVMIKAASVSLLMLQATMLTTFGGDELMVAKMNGISGAAVVVLILAVAIWILRKGFGGRSRPTTNV